MNRPHFLTVLLLAIVFAGLSYFYNPLNPSLHGFPLEYVTIDPLTQIPIFGWLYFLFSPQSSVTFNAVNFALDVAFFFAILWLIVVATTRKGKPRE